MDLAAPYLTGQAEETASGQVLGLITWGVNTADWRYGHFCSRIDCERFWFQRNERFHAFVHANRKLPAHRNRH